MKNHLFYFLTIGFSLVSFCISTNLDAQITNSKHNSKAHLQQNNSSEITNSLSLFLEDNSGCLSKSSGGKAGKTGSPGETSCTSCHAANTGNGSTIITSTDLTNWEYTPGQTYTINVITAQTGISLFSFGFEALLSTGANAGTLIITNSTETQIKNATVSGNVRNNVVQKSNGGATADIHTFTFNWTAPALGTGNITFYVAGCACDGDGGTDGDFTYTSSQVVSEVIPTAAPIASFIATTNTTICPNNSVNFQDQSSNSPTSWSWVFTGGNPATSTSQNPIIFYDTPGTYSVELTVTNAGGSNTATMTNFINVNAINPVTITEVTGILNSDVPSGNQWYEQTLGIIAGATGQTYSPTANGNYYTVVTDINGCVSTSNILSYIYIGVNENFSYSSIKLFPNPSNGIINISFENSVEGQFSIEDITGKLIYKEKLNIINGSVKTIDLFKFNNGVYFFNINNMKYKVVIVK